MATPLSPHRTRDAAWTAGATRYYTGELCKHGHRAERFVSNGGCMDCVNRKVQTQARSSNVRILAPVIFDGRAPPVTPEELAHLNIRLQRDAPGWLTELRASGITTAPPVAAVAYVQASRNMTDKAGGRRWRDFSAEGWTDQQLLDHGYMYPMHALPDETQRQQRGRPIRLVEIPRPPR